MPEQTFKAGIKGREGIAQKGYLGGIQVVQAQDGREKFKFIQLGQIRNLSVDLYKLRSIMNFTLFFLLVGLLATAQTYSIEGKWRVVNLEETSIPSQFQLTTTISEFIFRNRSIRWAISFDGCSHYKYQMQVDENELFIDLDTFVDESQNIDECPIDQISHQRSINSLLKKVFTFQIISNYMTFSDLNGKVIFKFQRIHQQFSVQSITGNWNLRILQGSPFNQIIQINQTHISFCQRKAFLKYELIPNIFADQIVLSGLVDQGCGFALFVKAMKNVKFIRPLNYPINEEKIIELYSEDDELITVLYFVMDLSTAEKQRAEQQILKAQLEKERQARIQELRNQEYERQIAEQQAQKQTVIEVVKNLTGKIDDIEGKWKIKSVFKIPNFMEKLELVITSSNLVLSGGCNTHIVLYQAGQKKGEIRVGALRSTKKACPVDDDGLFVMGLQKIQKYSVEIKGKQVIAQFFDGNNKVIFELGKPVEYQTIIVRNDPAPVRQTVAPAPPRVATPPPPPPQPLPTGRYMVLLLKRRDLPRRFANVDSAKREITFKVCNDLKFTYELDQPKKGIKIKQGKSGPSTNCSPTQVQQQKIVIDYFKSVIEYNKVGDDINLSNKQEGEVIALNSL